MDEVNPILCGKCNVPIKITVEGDGEPISGACPECGNTDQFDAIVREVTEYKLDNIVRGKFSDLQTDSLTVKSPPQRQYRWIIAS